MGKSDRQALPLRPARYWPCLLVAAAAVIPFLPGAGGGFLFDDVANLLRNPALHHFDLARLFTDPTAFSGKPGNWPYRPVTLIINALLFAGFGAHSATPWRLVQIALHGANSLLVLAVARRVFRLEKGAIIAALLFALSPLTTQAVLYLSARGVTQALTPALAAVLVLAAAADAPERKRSIVLAAAGLALAATAFLSYEGALVLAGWLIIAAWARGENFRSPRVFAPLAGAAVLAALYLVLRHLVSPADLLTGHEAIRPDLSRTDQVLAQLRTPGLMFRLFVLPTDLCFVREVTPAGAVLDYGLTLALAAAAIAALLLRQRVVASGLAWYLGSLLPAALAPLNTPWAEHRAYLALPGLALAAAALLEPAWRMDKTPGRLARAAVMALLLLLALNTAHRASQWGDSSALLAAAARREPQSPVVWSFLAADAQAHHDCRRALPWIGRALALDPHFADGHNTRAACLIARGRSREAVQAATRAVKLNRDNPYYWRTLALAYLAAAQTDDARRILQSLLDHLPPHDPLRPLVEQDWQRINQPQR